MQAVENLKTVNGDLDRSKPFVANLESSDQLVEDSFLSCDGQRVEIDATPLPVRKKGKRGNKRKIEQVENKEPVVSLHCKRDSSAHVCIPNYEMIILDTILCDLLMC